MDKPSLRDLCEINQMLMGVYNDPNRLEHYGMPKRSGRYPYGSGENPYQHEETFLGRIRKMKNGGMSDGEIADSLGMSVNAMKKQIAVEKEEERLWILKKNQSLLDRGVVNRSERARQLDMAESTLRDLEKEERAVKINRSKATRDALKSAVDAKGFIDVSSGTELELGVSSGSLATALKALEDEGYSVKTIMVPQATNPRLKTITKVLCPPDYDGKYIDANNVKSFVDYEDEQKSNPNVNNTNNFRYPTSVDSKRIYVRYAEDGGTDKDGIVELRRDVEDLSLGNSHYAQVRIGVDGTHYIKGMAVYSDDVPKGYDIIVNSNKKKGTPLTSSDPDAKQVLKPMKVDDATGKIDADNPFGAYIPGSGQHDYVGKDGKTKLSAINKIHSEGEWGDYSKELPAQMLAKQPKKLIARQLQLTYEDKLAEYDELMSLTNPTVKRAMLKAFADDCDGAAVDLKAKGFPGQKYHVLLSIPEIKETEVFAPGYENGTKLALIRFPHAGTFEIPIVTVNNKNAEGSKVIGKQSRDAIGIHPKVAERLSGADFDGDTALVIPMINGVNIHSTEPLHGLKNFDPKKEYPEVPGMRYMRKKEIGNEMGMISNLITDMTIKGATREELERATKHSMVVIDAYKHKLDYKRSEIDNEIQSLKNRYQKNSDGKVGGASTLLSKAKSPDYADKYKGQPKIDPKTGEYTNEGKTLDTYYDFSAGVTKVRKEKVTKMAATKDARTLSSGTEVEELYADYANKVKALANKARLSFISTPRAEQHKDAAFVYKKEVESLNLKYMNALKNSPKERLAQRIANSKADSKINANPQYDDEKIKRVRQQALDNARTLVGAKKEKIVITDAEWRAIQAGAISDTRLEKMLNSNIVDSDSLRERATPKKQVAISDAKQQRIKALAASGHTLAEIANAVGVSTSSVSNIINA